jgi:hypothetical protein
MNIYYIYFYLRTDGTPYYIGKGKGKRAYSDKHKVAVPSTDRITFPLINLTEEQALSNEKEFIAWYGRKDNNTGILRNRTDGGEGLSNPSEETRRKISVANKGRNLSTETKLKMSESRKGRTHSEETRRKLSEAKKGNQHNLGKNHSAESKRKISEGLSGLKHSQETRRKMSESKKGKPRSEETCRKISEARKLYWISKNSSQVPVD